MGISDCLAVGGSFDERGERKAVSDALTGFLDINLKNGKITYNEFNIDFSVPYLDQIQNLTEDLLQIEYDGAYILDVGWYPEFDSSGCFNVCVVKNREWNKPLMLMNCRNEAELRNILTRAVEFIVEYEQL